MGPMPATSRCRHRQRRHGAPRSAQAAVIAWPPASAQPRGKGLRPEGRAASKARAAVPNLVAKAGEPPTGSRPLEDDRHPADRREVAPCSSPCCRRRKAKSGRSATARSSTPCAGWRRPASLADIGRARAPTPRDERGGTAAACAAVAAGAGRPGREATQGPPPVPNGILWLLRSGARPQWPPTAGPPESG
jgi:hypothetical protein